MLVICRRSPALLTLPCPSVSRRGSRPDDRGEEHRALRRKLRKLARHVQKIPLRLAAVEYGPLLDGDRSRRPVNDDGPPDAMGGRRYR